MNEAQEDVASFAAKEWARANVAGCGASRNPAIFGAMAAQVYLGAMKALRADRTAEQLIAELAAEPALCGMLRAPELLELRSPGSCKETCRTHPVDVAGAV